MRESEITTPRDEMVSVWRLQWIRRSELKRWQSDGVPAYTRERLDSLIQGAYEAGWKDGEMTGRYNHRVGIENGNLEPVTPREGSD